MKNWGCGAAGSALEWHSRGQGFDPPQLHFFYKVLKTVVTFKPTKILNGGHKNSAQKTTVQIKDIL